MTLTQQPLQDPPAWHVLSAEETAARLAVDPRTGLRPDEVARRAATYGANEIAEQRRRGPGRMLVGQFTDFMIVVLIGAAIISGLIGDPEDTLAIVVIVLLNGIIGFAQEYRAERAVAALKQLAAATATLRRDDRVMTVPAAQVVPGDIVLLEAGNLLPADVRLLEAVHLSVDESTLTGESVPVEKCTAPLGEAALALGDRRNMAYKGTVVTDWPCERHGGGDRRPHRAREDRRPPAGGRRIQNAAAEAAGAVRPAAGGGGHRRSASWSS